MKKLTVKPGLLLLLISIIIFTCKQTNIVKEELAQTPPMGWNSFDCFGGDVYEHEVKANADFMAEQLKQYGWEYIVVDYMWHSPKPYPDNKHQKWSHGKPLEIFPMDKYGRLMPAVNRFPSASEGKGFKALADYVHQKGLKFGIHIMKGIPKQAVYKNTAISGSNYHATDIANINDTCTWLNHMYGLNMKHPGAQAYLNSLFELYASWEIDFVKIDDISRPFSGAEIFGYQKAIENCGRPIVLSLSPGDAPVEKADSLRQLANMWRISNDVEDKWPMVVHMFDLCKRWEGHSGAGHWADADMLPLGHIAIRYPRNVREEHDCYLSQDEQKTLMSLWAIFQSPLMFGGHLPQCDEYTISFLTNNEVIKVNQYCSNSRELFRNDSLIVWTADATETNEKYFAVFNLSMESKQIEIQINQIGIKTKATIRDLWEHKNMGEFSEKFSATIPAHGSGLYLSQIKH